MDRVHGNRKWTRTGTGKTRTNRDMKTELQLNRNDQSIRRLLDDLVSGTKELKELYTTGEVRTETENG